MLSPFLNQIALLIAVCPFVIQPLALALAIGDSSATSHQSIEISSRSSAQDKLANVSSDLHSSHHGPQEATSLVGKQNLLSDSRRPVWNMAHMVNSIKELDYRLGKGANAIEVDVTFGRDGDPLYTYHGPPCDCWRHCHQQEEFNEFLRYVREITTADEDGIGKNLTLMLLDLKLDPLDFRAKARAGTELAKSVVENLFPPEMTQVHTNKGPIIALIISINHVTDIQLVHNFLHQMEMSQSLGLMPRIGFDVGMNDDIQQIETMWKRYGNQLNLWQGDGFTNCFSPFYNLERLSKALQKRDQDSGFPRKVYQWTIDMHDRMREALRMGVDAVMTNHPERLVAILQEPELAHNFRFATRDDDPFKKIAHRSKGGETGRYQRSASQSSGGFFAGLMDILSSWMNWVREIPFLSLPTTSRFLPSSPKRQKQAEKRARPDDHPLAKSSSSNNDGTLHRSATTASAHQILSAKRTESTSVSAGTTDLDNAGSSITTTTTTSSSSPPPTNETQPNQPYEGPKWYTHLASNLLVSAMKVALPATSGT